jgi:hypothetical protein
MLLCDVMVVLLTQLPAGMAGLELAPRCMWRGMCSHYTMPPGAPDAAVGVIRPHHVCWRPWLQADNDRSDT